MAALSPEESDELPKSVPGDDRWRHHQRWRGGQWGDCIYARIHGVRPTPVMHDGELVVWTEVGRPIGRMGSELVLVDHGDIRKIDADEVVLIAAGYLVQQSQGVANLVDDVPFSSGPEIRTHPYGLPCCTHADVGIRPETSRIVIDDEVNPVRFK
jgi:hypothetical protein